MKFLKTIRFDPSDMNVFEHAAEPDQWAIPGGFYFTNLQEDDLKGKTKQAFSNGFLSLETFGFSTFVSVADINPDEITNTTHELAQNFVEAYGAPDLSAALSVAEQEISFVVEMCAEVPINTIFALGRYFDENGEVREEFRIVEAPREAVHTKVWEIVE